MPKKSKTTIKFRGKELDYIQAVMDSFPFIEYPQELFRALLKDWAERNPEFHKQVMEKIHSKTEK